MKKKILTSLLALVMVLTMTPLAAFADGEDGGSGTTPTPTGATLTISMKNEAGDADIHAENAKLLLITDNDPSLEEEEKEMRVIECASGSVTIDSVAPGTYKLIEITAPTGCDISREEWKIVVADDLTYTSGLSPLYNTEPIVFHHPDENTDDWRSIRIPSMMTDISAYI